MNHFKKELYQSKTQKLIKLYICKNREIEITFKNCLIFRENNLVPLGLFDLFQSTLVYFSPLLPIWPTLVSFGLFGPIWSILAYLVHCVCKVVIYNYVLCWLYFMTKSVVIVLILFLVFCEILLYWV